MPAEKLSHDATTVRRFDVLVEIPTDDLPTHVMLCNEVDNREDVKLGASLQIVDMQPPLNEGTGSEYHAVATAELSDEQQQKIKTFVSERFDETKALRRRELLSQYRIDPPITRPSRDFSFWRFSCVGFVLAAYEAARISLISGPYPLKNLDQIKQMYPDQSSRLDKPEKRERMGIGVGTEWPVVLAGYVMNAFDRPATEIHGNGSSPFQPVEGDEFFPSRRNGE